MAARRQTRRLLAVAALLVAVVVALLLSRRRNPAPAAATAPVAGGPTEELTRRRGAAPGLPPIEVGNHPTAAPIEGRGTTPLLAVAESYYQRPEGMRELREAYQRANRYPPDSQPLRADMLDVIEPNRVYEQPLPAMDPELGEDGVETDPERAVFYQLIADKYSYVGDEPIALQLLLYRGERAMAPVPAALTPVRVSRLGLDGEQVMDHIVLRGADEKGAKTGAAMPPYIATYHPAAGPLADHSGLVKFALEFQYGEGRRGAASLVLSYTSAPPAVFTGGFRDAVEDGSLAVYASVDVLEAGRYQIDARLYRADGATPLGYALWNGVLPAGPSEVRLRYYGLLFQEAGAPGPYVQKDLFGYRILEQQANTRGAEMPAYTTPYRTAAYPLEGFTSAEWTSPQKEAALETYDREIRRLEAEQR